MSLIDSNNNGKDFLEKESAVKNILVDIINLPEGYSMAVFSRNPIYFQIKQTKLMTHNYFVIVSNAGEYHTLSFYGTNMHFSSKGVWVFDSESDLLSYNMYMEGKRRWDVKKMPLDGIIDVKQTLQNVIIKMDSNITYYYRDHIKNKPNVDNCNTALYESIVLKTDVSDSEF